MNDQVEACLGWHVAQRGQHLQRVVSTSEHHQVVSDQRILHEAASAGARQHLELILGRLAVVHAERVARLEVDRQRRIRKRIEVDLQDLERHVVVVELAVAQRDIHVERQVLSVFEQQALVDVGRLLVVAPLEVDRRQRQLVLNRLRQLLVVLHQLGFIAHLVCTVEQDARLQGTPRALKRRLLRVLVQAHVVRARSGVREVQRVRVVERQQILVDAESLIVFAIMEVAVGQKLQVANVMPVCMALEL
mmetsp:Transcript_35995/g.106435  ORF Transcript_35995/g.106435 Transcript_35995/m.106435 type:complete len:248 (+) Transcript_35995:1608-2351(+)